MPIPKIKIPINDSTRNLIRNITSGKALSRANVALIENLGLSKLGLDTISSLLSDFSEGARGDNTYAALAERMFGGQENDNRRNDLPNADEKSNIDSEEYRRESLRITHEINAIVTNAKKKHTLFKAPNGKPTNLNPMLWIMVRTKNFKEWFGDWLKNPDDASKVVDENGEPKVVYHGTSRTLERNKFDTPFIFTSDNEIIGAGYGFQRKGFSLGIDYALSSFAGEDIVSFKEHIDSLIKTIKIDIELGEDMPFYQEGDLERSNRILNALLKAKEEIKNRDIFKELKFDILDIFLSIKNPLIVDAKGKYWHSIEFEGSTQSTDTLAEIAKDRGYDGLIVKNVIDKGGEVSKNGEFADIATDYIAFNPNQIKSATDNNGIFSRENDDIQMMADRKQIEYITDSLSDTEKEDIRNVLLKINKAGRTLIDTGEGLYLVDHTDKEGIINRKEGQEGFQCVVKIDTEGLRKQQINDIKDGYQKTEKTPRGFDDWLEANGYSNRLRNSDSIDAEVRRSNADNAGLDTEASRGESLGEPSDSSSQEDFGADFIKVRDSDGTNSKRVVPRDFFSKKNNIPFYLLKTPEGEVEIYGFIDPETNDMYLDETVISPEHPIHEYAHLWDKAVYERNKPLWNRGVELMKKFRYTAKRSHNTKTATRSPLNNPGYERSEHPGITIPAMTTTLEGSPNPKYKYMI